MKKGRTALTGWPSTAILMMCAATPFVPLFVGLSTKKALALSLLAVVCFWPAIGIIACTAVRHKKLTGTWELPSIIGGPSMMVPGRRHYTPHELKKSNAHPN